MSENAELSRIKRVDVRQVWPHEAEDFTPWLGAHIAELGEALGIELELQSLEAPVGAYSLDILASESGSNAAVVIENQLGRTDHEHLGQLLAYAGGFDADVVIWVTKELREEHRQAIDWLNRRTSEATRFFGVVVEVWSIDGSRPAPHFRVAAAPNAWQREASEGKRAGSVSERYQRYQAFFQKLIDRMREQGFTNARRAQLQSSYRFAVGHSTRVQLVAAFREGGAASVGVFIGSPDAGRNKTLFDALHDRRDPIESELRKALRWQRMDHAQASRIDVLRQGTIDDGSEQLSELETWMATNLEDFKRVFGPHLDELAD